MATDYIMRENVPPMKKNAQFRQKKSSEMKRVASDLLHHAYC